MHLNNYLIKKEASMKNKWSVFILTSLCVLLLATFLTGCSGTVGETQVQVGQQPEGFWVSGTGEVTVTPNLATISLGIQSTEKNVADTQMKAADGMSKLMQALKDSRIDTKDIQTGYFSIDQRTRWNDYDQTNTITGYTVTNTVTVKVRDINNVGNIIDTAVKAGGDLIRINSLNFSVEEPSKYYQEAREKAIANARDKAEQYARLLGATLGKPTYVVEGTQSSNVYGNYYGGNYSIPAPSVVYSLAESTSISPGENKITLNVTVSYELIK